MTYADVDFLLREARELRARGKVLRAERMEALVALLAEHLMLPTMLAAAVTRVQERARCGT